MIKESTGFLVYVCARSEFYLSREQGHCDLEIDYNLK